MINPESRQAAINAYRQVPPADYVELASGDFELKPWFYASLAHTIKHFMQITESNRYWL